MPTAEFLSRLQFAWVMSFHILFPAFTIGTAAWLAFIEGVWLFKRTDLWRDLYFFWLKIFAVAFGMGVVSGIVMSFQFGTNWAGLSTVAGNVLGPLLNYEVMTAFFLEATFLGVMLFGWNRVGHRTHFFATCMVALGTLISSFWILAANSWMQTPVGHELVDGRYVPVDWLAIIFNPSFPYRLVHTVTGFYLTTAFAVLGVTAWHLKHGRHVDEARAVMRMTVTFIAIFVPIQIIAGDLHGINTMHHQPVKLAAMEGLWETQARAPAVLFAIPDQRAERNYAEISIPVLASIYLAHSPDAVIKGLKEAPPEDRPPVAPVFYAFRVMVGVGILMLAMAVWGLWLRRRGRLDTTRAYLNACIAMLPAGFVAVLAGWTVTEVGRQPWVVYGLMRTRDAVSPSLTGADVLLSIALYVAVYLIIFGAGIFYMARLARSGPPAHVEMREPHLTERPARPLSGAHAELP